MSRSWQMEHARAPATSKSSSFQDAHKNCSRASPGKSSSGSDPAGSRGLVFAEMRQQRAERLVSLLEVACLQKPVVDDDETQVLREDQTPPSPARKQATGGSLSGMLKHLSCQRDSSSAADAEMKQQVRELHRRRDAASKLIDEVEAEVFSLGQQLLEKAPAGYVAPGSKAAAKIGSYPEGWYNGFHEVSVSSEVGRKHTAAPSAASGLPHYLPKWVPCGEDCAPRTDTRAIVSRSTDLSLMIPAPALRCELQKNLADAHKEIADLQQEMTALRQEQGVSLYDHRPVHLAFTRGKDCGGQLTERVMDHLCYRTDIAEIFLAWRRKAVSRRHIHRVDLLLSSPGDRDRVEAYFTAWKTLALQQYANWSCKRLERADASLGNLGLRMLASTSLEMVRQLLLAWWMDTKMASIHKRKLELTAEAQRPREAFASAAVTEGASTSEASSKELLAGAADHHDGPADKDMKKAGGKRCCSPCGSSAKADTGKAGGKRCCVLM